MASTGGGSAYATDILAIQVSSVRPQLGTGGIGKTAFTNTDCFRDRICTTNKILVLLDPFYCWLVRNVLVMEWWVDDMNMERKVATELNIPSGWLLQKISRESYCHVVAKYSSCCITIQHIPRKRSLSTRQSRWREGPRRGTGNESHAVLSHCLCLYFCIRIVPNTHFPCPLLGCCSLLNWRTGKSSFSFSWQRLLWCRDTEFR